MSGMIKRLRNRGDPVTRCPLHPGRQPRVPRRAWMVALSAGLLLSLMACASQQSANDTVPPTLEGKPPVGRVEMSQEQAAFIGSGSVGNGNLYFRGTTYPFTVDGLGVGGIGVSTIEATGDVYNLENVTDFPGAYGQARYGFALGTASAGDLWLENPNGVVLHVIAKRTGLMLSLGADAVVITMQ